MSEIRRLEERVEYLEAENAYLRSLFGDELLMPPGWRLTPQEARFVRGLLVLRHPSRRDLHAFLRYGEGEDKDTNVVSVLACRIRPKLAPFGIWIESGSWRGYHFPDEARAEAERQIKAANPDLPAYFRTVA